MVPHEKGFWLGFFFTPDLFHLEPLVSHSGPVLFSSILCRPRTSFQSERGAQSADAYGFDGAHLRGYTIRVMLRPSLAPLSSCRITLKYKSPCSLLSLFCFVVFLQVTPVCY